MKRIFWFGSGRLEPPPQAWHLPPEQHRQLLDLLSQIGLHIVHEARGPVPLLAFGRRMLEQLGATGGTVPVAHFADALKRIIREMQHERLRVMSPTESIGVGYVYNAEDPDTWPVRSSR